MKRIACVAALLAAAALLLPTAAACADEGNDEDAVGEAAAVIDTVVEAATAINDRDFDRLAGLVTANAFGVEPTSEALETRLTATGFRIENLEILSVIVIGDEAEAEISRTQDGETIQETASLVKLDGRWRLDRVE